MLRYLQTDYSELAFEYQCDPTSKRLQHVIWMVPEQKIAYSRFITLIQNQPFSMPFGIFSGVNNYGQSVCSLQEEH